MKLPRCMEERKRIHATLAKAERVACGEPGALCQLGHLFDSGLIAETTPDESKCASDRGRIGATRRTACQGMFTATIHADFTKIDPADPGLSDWKVEGPQRLGRQAARRAAAIKLLRDASCLAMDVVLFPDEDYMIPFESPISMKTSADDSVTSPAISESDRAIQAHLIKTFTPANRCSIEEYENESHPASGNKLTHSRFLEQLTIADRRISHQMVELSTIPMATTSPTALSSPTATTISSSASIGSPVSTISSNFASTDMEQHNAAGKRGDLSGLYGVSCTDMETWNDQTIDMVFGWNLALTRCGTT